MRTRVRVIFIFLFVVFLGFLIPLFLRIGDTGPSLCHEQTRLLTPRLFRLFTIRTKIIFEGDRVISSARTLFDVPLNHITFPSLEDCEFGTGAHIEYYLFYKQ